MPLANCAARVAARRVVYLSIYTFPHGSWERNFAVPVANFILPYRLARSELFSFFMIRYVQSHFLFRRSPNIVFSSKHHVHISSMCIFRRGCSYLNLCSCSCSSLYLRLRYSRERALQNLALHLRCEMHLLLRGGGAGGGARTPRRGERALRPHDDLDLRAAAARRLPRRAPLPTPATEV